MLRVVKIKNRLPRDVESHSWRGSRLNWTWLWATDQFRSGLSRRWYQLISGHPFQTKIILLFCGIFDTNWERLMGGHTVLSRPASQSSVLTTCFVSDHQGIVLPDKWQADHLTGRGTFAEYTYCFSVCLTSVFVPCGQGFLKSQFGHIPSSQTLFFLMISNYAPLRIWSIWIFATFL